MPLNGRTLHRAEIDPTIRLVNSGHSPFDPEGAARGGHRPRASRDLIYQAAVHGVAVEVIIIITFRRPKEALTISEKVQVVVSVDPGRISLGQYTRTCSRRALAGVKHAVGLSKRDRVCNE